MLNILCIVGGYEYVNCRLYMLYYKLNVSQSDIGEIMFGLLHFVCLQHRAVQKTLPSGKEFSEFLFIVDDVFVTN